MEEIPFRICQTSGDPTSVGEFSVGDALPHEAIWAAVRQF